MTLWSSINDTKHRIGTSGPWVSQRGSDEDSSWQLYNLVLPQSTQREAFKDRLSSHIIDLIKFQSSPPLQLKAGGVWHVSRRSSSRLCEQKSSSSISKNIFSWSVMAAARHSGAWSHDVWGGLVVRSTGTFNIRSKRSARKYRSMQSKRKKRKKKEDNWQSIYKNSRYIRQVTVWCKNGRRKNCETRLRRQLRPSVKNIRKNKTVFDDASRLSNKTVRTTVKRCTSHLRYTWHEDAQTWWWRVQGLVGWSIRSQEAKCGSWINGGVCMFSQRSSNSLSV